MLLPGEFRRSRFYSSLSDSFGPRTCHLAVTTPTSWHPPISLGSCLVSHLSRTKNVSYGKDAVSSPPARLTEVPSGLVIQSFLKREIIFLSTTYMCVFEIRKWMFKLEKDSHRFRKALVTSGFLSLPHNLIATNEDSVPRFRPSGRLLFFKGRNHES